MIIKTKQKIARWCGCPASQSHNIYDAKGIRAPDWCKWMSLRWKSAEFLWTESFLVFASFQATRKRVIQMFHRVCCFSGLCFVLFLFLNVCNTVTLLFGDVERRVLYYFCTFVYKSVKKSLNSNPPCAHAFLLPPQHSGPLNTTTSLSLTLHRI